MDISDEVLTSNFDWDLEYLQEIFKQDFYEIINDLWCTEFSDMEVVDEACKIEKYCPVTEDISVDDDFLCSAVEKIESELVYFVFTLGEINVILNFSIFNF